MDFLSVTPEQIAQAGIGTILALVMWALIRLQMAQNRTNAANETARNAQMTMLLQFQSQQNSDRQQAALVIAQHSERIEAMRRDMLEEQKRVAERHASEMSFFKGMVEAVQLHTRDTTDALGAIGEHVTGTVTRDLEAGRQRMLEAVKSVTNKEDLAAAVKVSTDNQNANHTVVMERLGSVDEKVTTIGLNTHEIPQWQQAVNDIVRTVNKIELMLDRQKETNNLLSGIRDGINEIKADVAKLLPPAPSFDTVATAEVLKRKTDPLPAVTKLSDLEGVSAPPSLTINDDTVMG